jgi:cell division protein FtsI/penicillin-binding protein 2
VARLPRATIAKVAAVVVVVGVIGLGLVKGNGPSAEPTVQAYLLAWENGQYKAAAAMTTGRPAVAAGALKAASHELDAADLVLEMGRVTQHGAVATAHFYASVDLGSGGLSWTYQGSFGMRRTSAGWKVRWSPSDIVPGLRPGDRLAVLSSMPSRAQIDDSAGGPLARPSPVYVIGVRPDRLAHPRETANALAAVTGIVDSAQVYGQIVAAPSTSFLELVRLGPAQYARLRAKLAKVPGLTVFERRARLFDSIAPAVTGSVGTETSAVLRQQGVPYRPGSTVGLSGLQAAYQGTLAGSAATEVLLENASGHVVSVLRRWPGGRATAVRTTIDSGVQVAADQALAGLPESAAIVAIQPGTGRILAVAQHQAGGMPAVSALAGQYQPGQAFTIVSAAALLDSAGVTASSPIPCKAENSIGGIKFSNHPREVGLGSQPAFSVDFAHACGTAIAGLSILLNAKELASAAKGFGIGADWQLKIGSYTGTIGDPTGYGQVAATSVGLGGVQVSPLDMALAAGLVQSGTWHSPELVTSPNDDPPLVLRGKFSAQVVSSLRALMRATVTKGAGTAANVGGGLVYGQIGNSALSSAGKAGRGLRTAWFVGYQGKIAFAVVEFAKSADASSAPLAGTFLQDLRADS